MKDDLNTEKSLLFLLGFIVFLGILGDLTHENTFQIIALIFVLLLIKKVRDIFIKKLMTRGWNEVINSTKPLVIALISLLILVFLLSWYMNNPTLVNIGGIFSEVILILIGTFLIGSMLWALTSILIDKFKKSKL